MAVTTERGGSYRVPFTRALLHPRHWGTWTGIGLLALIALLPRPVARAIGRALGRLLPRTMSKRRRIARINLGLCFPERDAAAREALVDAHFRVVAQCFVDYPLLWFGGSRAHLRYLSAEGLDHVEALHAEGRPVIICAAHTPALDFGGLLLARRHGGVSFAKPMKNPVVEWINHRSRTQYGTHIYSRAHGLRPLVRAMRAGRSCYFLPDEDLGPEHAVFAPFFGVPKATVPSLAMLARLAHAAVIPAMCLYDEAADRYVIRIDPPLSDFPSGDDERDAARMNAALEALIRRAPAQYLWTLKLFKTRPDGGLSPYKERPAVE
ncbi:MAG: lysophospholipid acyltransferase family protein [Chromatiales bacterium]|nr:lysophospholipid acyltransferase family protein [Chromatiales bacterium]